MKLISQEELNELRFHHTHNIKLENGEPRFVPVKAEEQPLDASVYMWLAEDSNTGQFGVLYVGKAGYGISKRLKEHTQGFVNSGSGKQNRVLLVDYLSSGRQIRVVTKVAGKQEIFGQEVTLYSSEEHALADRFSPEWNRAKFPVSVLQEQQSGEYAGKSAALAGFADVAGFEDIFPFIDSLDDASTKTLNEIASYLRRVGISELDSKVVKGYTGQPGNCDNVPVITFCKMGDQNALPHSWAARVPLQEPITIIFPNLFLSPNQSQENILRGRDDNFRPRDIDDFLRESSAYVLESAIDSHIKSLLQKQA